MAPLEKRRPQGGREARAGRRSPSNASTAKPAQAPPARREKQRFKVVDVLGGRVLVQDVGAREAVASAAASLRSVLDARVSVWSTDARRWKLLSLDEQKALWRLRDRSPAR